MARCARINKQPVYYALFRSVSEIVDANGDYSGEYTTTYPAPTKAYMNVSPTQGGATAEPYGIDEGYTLTLETDDMETPFDTSTVFWIGIEPTETHVVNGQDVMVDIPHNYMVTRVSRGLPKSGTCKIIAKEVNISG